MANLSMVQNDNSMGEKRADDRRDAIKIYRGKKSKNVSLAASPMKRVLEDDAEHKESLR